MNKSYNILNRYDEIGNSTKPKPRSLADFNKYGLENMNDSQEVHQ